MRTNQFALLRSFRDILSPRFQHPHSLRTFSTDALRTDSGDKEDDTPPPTLESSDDFERRIFGESSGGATRTSSFFGKLDRIGRGRDSFASDMTGGRGRNASSILDGLGESFDTLRDGMDRELEKEATYFEFEPEEVMQDDYSFRPDANFRPGMTYNVKDLDLTKPTYRKPVQRSDFKITTEEVLRKADFRNVRFLALFLTEAGIIKKRNQTRISAKAQRKVAREIKTARAFGLMPFTTMGTKSFFFGQTMEDSQQDFEYESLVSDDDTIPDVEN